MEKELENKGYLESEILDKLERIEKFLIKENEEKVTIDKIIGYINAVFIFPLILFSFS